MPLIFGDERDSVIAKWNQLQAFWGTGRGHYNSQGHFVDFTADNPFSFFKVLNFSVCPKLLKFLYGLILVFVCFHLFDSSLYVPFENDIYSDVVILTWQIAARVTVNLLCSGI